MCFRLLISFGVIRTHVLTLSSELFSFHFLKWPSLCTHSCDLSSQYCLQIQHLFSLKRLTLSFLCLYLAYMYLHLLLLTFVLLSRLFFFFMLVSQILISFWALFFPHSHFIISLFLHFSLIVLLHFLHERGVCTLCCFHFQSSLLTSQIHLSFEFSFKPCPLLS